MANSNGKKTTAWIGLVLGAAVLVGSLISAWVSVQSSLADTYDKGEVQQIVEPVKGELTQIRERSARMEKSIEYISKGQDKMDTKIDGMDTKIDQLIQRRR